MSPEYVVHDLHPGYASTAWALAQTQPKLPCNIIMRISRDAWRSMDWWARDRVGVGWDWIWCGRAGVGRGSIDCAADGFERFAHLKDVAMPGSEAAVRQPWRMALGHLYAALGERVFDADVLARMKVREGDARLLVRMIERGVNSPLTSSCGRLFDAAAALILRRDRVDYEAQAAIELEGIAERDTAAQDKGYPLQVEDNGEDVPLILNPTSMWQELLVDLRRGEEPAKMSARFHAGVADAYVRAVIAAKERTGIRNACLSGGVFHNRLLTHLVCVGLRQAGMETHLPVLVSPGDGGLSYGQAVVAAALIGEGTRG